MGVIENIIDTLKNYEHTHELSDLEFKKLATSIADNLGIRYEFDFPDWEKK